LQADLSLGGARVFGRVLQSFQAAEVDRSLGVLAEPPDPVGLDGYRQQGLGRLGIERSR
jgi:hypothetical protein